MLTQQEVDFFLNLPKKLVSTGSITFPKINTACLLDAISLDGRIKFIIDINRKGKRKPTKCTYQNRYKKDIILLRLDIDGPEHENPDGIEIPCPHIHIYREGYETKWAYPLPDEVFENTNDLITTLLNFLNYCRVVNTDQIAGIQGGLL